MLTGSIFWIVGQIAGPPFQVQLLGFANLKPWSIDAGSVGARKGATIAQMYITMRMIRLVTANLLRLKRRTISWVCEISPTLLSPPASVIGARLVTSTSVSVTPASCAMSVPLVRRLDPRVDPGQQDVGDQVADHQQPRDEEQQGCSDVGVLDDQRLEERLPGGR